MTEQKPQTDRDEAKHEHIPKRSRLKRILDENPEARPRVRNAVVSLLGTAVAAIAIVGLLLMWHFRRRGQLIRDRLGPPRQVSLPDTLADDDPKRSRADRED
jgi:hypothetical protein